MEIRIAICDDEELICKQVGDMIESILTQDYGKKNVLHTIDIFSDGQSLCEKLKEKTYDLIFLDIELPDTDGVTIGSYIRETLQDEKTQIAYISAKSQYAIKLFDFRPINFLVKPITSEAVKKVIDKYIAIETKGMDSFKMRRGKHIHMIHYEDILYFESKERKIFVHCVKPELDVAYYDNMDKVYESIKQSDFLYIHKSFLVNFRYVQEYSYEKVKMVDGTEIPISQSKRKEIREKMQKLLCEE